MSLSCAVCLSVTESVNCSLVLTLLDVQVTQSFVYSVSTCCLTQVRFCSSYIVLNQFNQTEVSVYFRSVSVLRSGLLEVSFSLSSIASSECQFTQVVVCTEIVWIQLSSLSEDSFLTSVVVTIR